MVIDLTRDSSEDELTYDVKPAIPTSHLQRDEGLILLQQFTRPKSQPGSSSSGISSSNDRKSKASTDGEVSTNEPSLNFAIVVPSVSGSDTSNKKRRLSWENDCSSRVNGYSSFPSHHGLSPFYSVEGSSKGQSYQPKHGVDRPSIQIKQPAVRYRPCRANNDENLLSLYAKKLRKIKGPAVTLNIKASDTSKLDFNFEFINEYKLQHGVVRVDADFHAGCRCERKCDLHNCDHLSYEVDSEDRIVPYQMGRGGKIVLRQDFLKRRAMIYECSLLCSCMPGCWNQVVQKGRTVKLEIFCTTNRGFGLRSPESIQAGQYIDRYLGEVITTKEADAREAATPGHAASYLFQLDFFSQDDDYYVVDGRKYGSITRFMNHSCNPNCKMFPVSQYDAELKIFDMAFFAIKDIPAGTELSFDYCPNYNMESSKQSDPQDVPCLCGEPNCRRKLWPNQRKTMQPEVD
ncbi:histone-lysine n-methyltransferase [Blastomyces gilchristii SLH14081]|uniref:Histone-lysine n-methyltransferase n=1 Tax=Blastomyces gilchristii (strain SLH14081) TaxID=559298 RepID=A0A179U6E8_BLAGS|nr:histone-lysine n-methyltransferase [Blastomyces gilchristii SLH14081]OAT03554.1 histone-lysine n-methyltransferase [Blastomyces gilchristii SLH14081]